VVGRRLVGLRWARRCGLWGRFLGEGSARGIQGRRRCRHGHRDGAGFACEHLGFNSPRVIHKYLVIAP
jgi:hypothetical protein